MESYTNPSDPWVKMIDGREVQYYRAGGNTICEHCSQKFYDHPLDETVLGYDGHSFLRRICSGDLVKL